MASKLSDVVGNAITKVLGPDDMHYLVTDHRHWLPRKNPMAAVLPFMLPITCTILALSLLKWNSQTWLRRSANFAVWVICLTLNRLGRPLTSLSLAAAVTVWTCLPGSFKALDLPDHSDFMRSLRTLPPGDDGEHEECMICWDNKYPLAELPCKHKECTGCLKLMGEHFQTACPLCHKALFAIHDRKIYALTKGSVSFAVVNWCLLFLSSIKNIAKGEYGMASMGVAVLFSNIMHFWMVGQNIRSSGENWWRGAPTKEKLQLRWVTFNFLMNLMNISITLSNMRGFFD